MLRNRLAKLARVVSRQAQVFVPSPPAGSLDTLGADDPISATGPRVRAAKPVDVPLVLPMVEKISALHQGWDPSRFAVVEHFTSRSGRWLGEVAADPHGIFLVAEADGRLVGFLIGTIDQSVPIYRVVQFGCVRELWVDEKYRRAGVGRMLMNRAIERFLALGIPQIRLETAAVNEPARAFFTSCGFRPSTVEMLLERQM